MTTIRYVPVLILFLCACEDDSTGGYGQPCNPDRSCTPPYSCNQMTNTCTGTGTHGGLNQPCLPNGQCNAGLTCNQITGTCQSGPSGTRGGLNQPCHAGNTCNAGLTCNLSTQICQSSGTQGELNQPCLPNNTCSVGLTCNQSTQICESSSPKGGLDQPCLPNNVCNSGLICNPTANICKSVMCGDMECATFANETCATCAGDCGNCCGNGTCEEIYSESHSTCPVDCPSNCADCSGCCDSGDCVSYAYQTDIKCGKPGEDCRSCDAIGASCDPVGTCKCDATTCMGCCTNVGTGQHEECVAVLAQDDDECGKNGTACVDCGDKLICSAGACICTPTSCPDGCCYIEVMMGKEIHTCIDFSFQSDFVCGPGGSTCKDCTLDEQQCFTPSGCAIWT